MASRIHKRRRPLAGLKVQNIPRAYDRILRLWILRLIHLGGGIQGERRNRPDLSREAIEAAGLGRISRWAHRSQDPSEGPEVEGLFRDALAKTEAAGAELPLDTVLARNLEWVGEAAGLSQTDRTILHFVTLAVHHPGLENALEQLGYLSLGALQAMFVRVLGVSAKEVARSLEPSGPLTRTGLLQLDLSSNYTFRGKVEPLPGLVDRLTMRHADPGFLFRGSFEIGRKAHLSLDRYPHLAKDLDLLVPYLRDALVTRRKGVNVLLHGTPGTGKTELVRAIAAHLGASLYEVASEHPNGTPVEGDERFRGYRLAQAVMGRHPGHLIFFDEIEDVFRPRNDSPRSLRNNESGIKAWVNRILEENPTPAFWVTNQLGILDEAFIRRCDFVIEMKNPPRSIRRRMLEDHLGLLPVSCTKKDQLAEHEGLSPALISRAARVASAVHRIQPGLDADQALGHLVGNTLEALGHTRSARQAVEVVTHYRPDLVNADCDLAAVCEGLRSHGQGRLCFYGPPGTGKTAYGRYLAEILDRPLLVKRASDLLSMWVGGTEKNLAAMFEEARTENAVLLLDEADGFLQERSGAQRNFEVTAVNEMLTQMEAFEGIFLASTNLMDRLDTAALRRFDLKVHFDYLQPAQAWVMFQDSAARLGLEMDPCLQETLSELGVLTPGDFATVLRQARMNRPRDARGLLARLEAECQAKPEGRRRPIGFMGRVS